MGNICENNKITLRVTFNSNEFIFILDLARHREIINIPPVLIASVVSKHRRIL